MCLIHGADVVPAHPKARGIKKLNRRNLWAAAPGSLCGQCVSETARYGVANAASNAIGYAMFFSRSHGAVICVYDDAGNVIQTHEHKGDFKEW
jgi:hypothetical protein